MDSDNDSTEVRKLCEDTVFRPFKSWRKLTFASRIEGEVAKQEQL